MNVLETFHISFVSFDDWSAVCAIVPVENAQELVGLNNPRGSSRSSQRIYGSTLNRKKKRRNK